jgi:hypothetical protein
MEKGFEQKPVRSVETAAIEELLRNPREAEFREALKRLGFAHLKAGTYFSEDLRAYAYCKTPALFADRAAAEKFLSLAKDFTKHELLSPTTEWGIVEKESGTFQAVAVTRQLQPVASGPTEAWSRLEHPLGYELYRRLGITGEGRIEEELGRPETPLRFIDPGESNYTQNWGWSPEAKKFFPTDVEVILLGGEEDMRESNRRAIATEMAENPESTEILNF